MTRGPGGKRVRWQIAKTAKIQAGLITFDERKKRATSRISKFLSLHVLKILTSTFKPYHLFLKASSKAGMKIMHSCPKKYHTQRTSKK